MIKRSVLIGLITLIGLSNAWSQISSFDQFGRQDGLPVMHIADLAQDDRGFLWIATSGGNVVIYDGQEFKDPNCNIDLYQYPNCIYTVEDEIWIGGDEGLIKLVRKGAGYDGKFVKGITQVEEIMRGDETTLLVCSDGGLSKVNTETLASTMIEESPTGCRCVTRNDDVIWMFTGEHLFSFEDDEWSRFEPRSGLPAGQILDLHVDHTGTLWLAMSGVGVLYKDNAQFRLLQVPGESISRQPTMLDQTGRTLMIGTSDQGLLKYDLANESLERIGYLSDMSVTSFLEDRDEVWWMGSERNGLLRKKIGSTKWIDTHHGLSEAEVTRLVPTNDGSIWSIGTGGSIDFLQDGKIEGTYPQNYGMHKITSWTGDLADSKWLGASNGLLEISDSAIFLIDAYRGRPLGGVHAISATSDSNQLIVASMGGLFAINNVDEKLQRLSLLPHIDLVFDGKYTWGVSTRSVTRTLEEEVGVVPFTKATEDEVRPTCIAVSDVGDILVGTRDHGVFSLEDDTLRPDKRYQVDGQIRSILFDGEKNVWLATEGVVIRFTASNQKVSSREVIWSRDQNSSFSEFNYRSAASDNRGHIYFGSNDGVLFCRNDGVNKPLRAPQLFLDAIAVGDSLISLAPDRIIDIEPEGDVAFAPRVLDLSSQGKVRVEWILEGSAKPEGPETHNSTIAFYQLRPGYYHFKVRAVNERDVRSQISSARFKILLPWWKQWWVPFLAIVLTVATVVAMLQRSTRLTEGKMRKEKEVLETQNHILRLEQQALRAQMNPHFIFNVLQTIQSKVALGSKEDARASIHSFSQLMRMYLEQSRSPSIAVEDEIRGLELYLALERETRDGSFDFTIEVDPAMDVAHDKIPSMLIQPIIENAIKHGMPRDGSKGQIEVRLMYKGKNIMCEIRDNGAGFSLNETPSDGRSAGLAVTENRLRNYFSKTISDPLQIVPRNFEDKDGTLAKMLIPILS